MSRTLIVEDSKAFAHYLRKEFEDDLRTDVVLAHTFAEAKKILEDYGAANIDLALLDLNLPDAPNGEVTPYMVKAGIPSIVFSGTYSEKLRDLLFRMGVLDYVVKENQASVRYLKTIAKRTLQNKGIQVLVVDDSVAIRKMVGDMLRLYNLTVFEAKNGNQALETLKEYPDIRLVITDYFMPDMDGYEMIKAIRQLKEREGLQIIGMSSGNDPTLTAKFLKGGANDFISKPFLREEFFCRITQNLELTSQIMDLQDAAIKDPMTQLHNRRYFFESATNLHSSAARGQITATVAVLDIDNFKNVNDTFGHTAGDSVIRAVANILKDFTRDTDVICRYGGEEFVIFAVNMLPDFTEEYFERLRTQVEDLELYDRDEKIDVTISIGVCDRQLPTLEDMIKEADACLYQAKEAGRNRVLVSR